MRIEPQPLAIVGMGCRFPGSVMDVASYWALLINRRSGITEIPPDRWDWSKYYHLNSDIPGRMVTKWGGFVDAHDQFDAHFFGISPREASYMDPQQRWLLEMSWQAFEDGGIAPRTWRGRRVGVFFGISSHDYIDIQEGDRTLIDIHTATGSALSITANRISHFFDLKGPSLAIDTACSSALVATHLACQSIWSGECTMAIAGGANALLNPNLSIGFSKASMLSPDGQCFAFDARANGYVRGEGAGVIIIKPLQQALADGDRIYASIRSTVVNQDGHTSSLTVPGIAAQQEMLREAYRRANIAPQRVAYVEAHGTGTPVGDPIEACALGQVLGQNRATDSACLIGSVKTNIGHLEAASGIAGLIKGALILHHDFIPPQLNFASPSPNISLGELGLQVVTEGQHLPHSDGQPPLVGINSFGFGGTNAHIVLEQAPPVAQAQSDVAQTKTDRLYALPISGRTEPALQALVTPYQHALAEQGSSLADLTTTAGQRREHLEHRLIVLGRDTNQLREQLHRYQNDAAHQPMIFTGQPAVDPTPPVFVFTGQGAQWAGMGQQLFEREPLVRQTIEAIDGLLAPLTSWSLLTEMTQSVETSQIDRTDIAQPAIFALQVALVELWRSWGIFPTKVIGHSVGEVAAAYAASVYSLEDAVKIIYHRSRLQHTTAGQGRMMAVGVSMTEAQQLISRYNGTVQIAADNSPRLVTLTGAAASLEAIASDLAAAGTFLHHLPINYAFHSPQMDPIQDDLLAALADIHPQPTRTPFVSTVTGEVASGTTMDANYWWDNVRKPVRFAPAIRCLVNEGHTSFLEVGPHPALQHSIRDCLSEQNQSGQIFHSLRRDTDESVEMLSNLAALHIYGLEINWSAVNQGTGHFVELPKYVWQRQTYWLEVEDKRRELREPFVHPLLGVRQSAATPTWQFQLDPRVLGYLDDHRLWDSIIFPAAGYGEMGLALAHHLYPDGSYAVENLKINKALFVSLDHLPTIQIVFEASGKTFTIYSASEDKTEWRQHAQGQLHPLASHPRPSANLSDLQANMTFFADHENYYGAYEEMGYKFGPNFQQIQNIWRGPDQALAEIKSTELVAEQLDDYQFHPALLDACFQAVSAAAAIIDKAQTDDIPYLPAALGRIQLFGPLPAYLWVKATVTDHQQTTITADFQVFDKTGRLVAEILQAQFDRVKPTGRNAAQTANHLYQFQWEPKRLKTRKMSAPAQFADSDDLLTAMTEIVPTLRETYQLKSFYEMFIPQFETVTQQIFQNCLIELGWDFSVDDIVSLDGLMKQLNIQARYRPLVQAELNALAQGGWLHAIHPNEWQVVQPVTQTNILAALESLAQAHPQAAPDVALMQVIAPNLAEVLQGKIDPLTLLFPEGSAALLTTFYRESRDQAASYHLIQTAVTQAITKLPPHRPLRILELGAGTGGLTEVLLSILPADQTEYTFTDISPKFLNEAKQKFSNYAFVEYRLFDLGQPPSAQDIEQHGYDLIVAANVIHATPDKQQALHHIADCLAQDGLLIFLEFTSRYIAYDTIFGLFEAWWQTDDSNAEAKCALLDHSEWEQLLTESGFRSVHSFASSPQADVYPLSTLIAVAPEIAEPDLEPTHAQATYLFFADEQDVATTLARRLTQTEARVLTVTPGPIFQAHDKQHYTIDPTSKADLSELLAEAQRDKAFPLAGIVHAWSLDQPLVDNLSPAELTAAQETTVLHLLHLAQVLAETHFSSPQVTVVGRGIQAVVEGDDCSGLAQAPLVGFLRVAHNEYPAFKWRLIDFDSSRPESEIETLLQELRWADDEREIAYRQHRRYANRLRQIKADHLRPLQRNARQANGEIHPYRLQFNQPGQLTNLSLNETIRRPLGPHEIEVQVRAGGLNFRDVMKALGMHPGTPVDLTWLGDDFSGVVVAVGEQVTDLKPGDAVVGLAPYAFRSHLTVKAEVVFRKPFHLSFAEAATLPTVFLTAYYALVHLAQMQPGERVLIHAGAGGVGQAAIQVAHDLGLEIFATAGTPEKRALLKSQGVPHVFDSRSLHFADEIRRVTQGQGVDAVLNSLAGDFIPKNFSVLAPFGRYLEIGKVDVYNDSKIGLEALRNNISVFIIDLAQLMAHKPALFRRMLETLSQKFEQKQYRPLPHKVFPVTEAVDAFRYMAMGKHIGKNVLSFDVADVPIGRITEAGYLFRPDVSYLITGGAGGFGLAVAKWLAQQGARHLVLMSRSGPPDEASQADIDQLRADGIVVVDARGDVTCRDDVKQVLQVIQNGPAPLGGAIHSAMVLHDELIINLNEATFNQALHPKLLGAWNLHQATLDLPLEHFICFSSLTSLVGTIKQANYSAGNAFLDSLAHYRRARGLPALTLNWGALSGAGFVARNQAVEQYLSTLGLKPLATTQALQMLGDIFPLDATQIGVAEVNWGDLSRYLPGVAQSSMFGDLIQQEIARSLDSSLITHIIAASPDDRLSLVEAFLGQSVAEVLNAEVSQIGLDTPLPQLGFDSLLSIELINSMNTQLNLNLAVSDVLGRTTIQDIAVILLDKILATTAGDQSTETANGQWLGVLEQTDTTVDLLAEAQLNPTIYPDKTASTATRPPQSILLTGATGFLGAFLLADLLQQTEADIYCLVRAENESMAWQRLQDNLTHYDLWEEQNRDRLKPVVGDLAQPHLGLSTTQFQHLAAQIDVIYHNGAVLNLVQPYQVLKPTNVLSVQAILQLASQTKLKPVHYISTIAVFFAANRNRQGVIYESDWPNPQALHGGYMQSKWVAEQLIRQAQARAIPCTIYRPGIITGHSQSGMTNTHDIASRLMKGSYQLGLYPDGQQEINIVPVDYVSRAIVHLSQQPETAGQVFHLTNPHATQLNNIIRWMSLGGATLQAVPYHTWRNTLIKQAEQKIENEILPLLPFFSSDRPEQIEQQVDCQNTLSFLAGSGIECPPINHELIETYVAYLRRVDFL